LLFSVVQSTALLPVRILYELFVFLRKMFVWIFKVITNTELFVLSKILLKNSFLTLYYQNFPWEQPKYILCEERTRSSKRAIQVFNRFSIQKNMLEAPVYPFHLVRLYIYLWKDPILIVASKVATIRKKSEKHMNAFFQKWKQSLSRKIKFNIKHKKIWSLDCINSKWFISKLQTTQFLKSSR
jgi:hypothetical protein